MGIAVEFFSISKTFYVRRVEIKRIGREPKTLSSVNFVKENWLK